jgi:DNA-binding transcriptional LysR family regulator
VNQLEDELGIKLLDRIGTKSTLTVGDRLPTCGADAPASATTSSRSSRIFRASSQTSFTLRLAAGGLGITFMPKLIAGLREHKDLALIALEDKSMSWDMTLAWRRGAFLSGAATAWLALAAEKEVVSLSLAAVAGSTSSEQRKPAKGSAKR